MVSGLSISLENFYISSESRRITQLLLKLAFALNCVSFVSVLASCSAPAARVWGNPFKNSLAEVRNIYDTLWTNVYDTHWTNLNISWDSAYAEKEN